MPQYAPKEVMQADSPGTKQLPSDVIYIHEHMTTTPPDVLDFICALYNVEAYLNLFGT